ncbi:MAG TPA: MerR family transcriptional regulator [Tepidisphaeraceae bacterium]|jgi:DNA-binding transcriptional MerR regulator
MEGQFSTAVVAELTGTSQRQLDYWARTRLLRPSAREAAGRGSRRRYTFTDLIAAQTVAKLRQANCPLQKIRKAVRYLRAHYPDVADARGLGRLTLMTDGQHVYILTDQRQVMDVVTRQIVWSVPLGKLIQETQTRVAAMPTHWVQPVQVRGRTYHLDVQRDPQVQGFTVQCRELPGAIEQGETAQEAIANGTAAIESVLEYQRRKLGAGAAHVKLG